MNQNLILLPVFAQVLITYFVLVVMGGRRKAALDNKATRVKDIALGQDAWPVDATKAANNFRNQFEVPVLFYAVAAFALITRSVDAWMLGLAAIFVAARTVHAVIHLGVNVVTNRAIWYLVGVAAVLGMWILLMVRTFPTSMV
jgi:hypothetical protein